jgi:hypothetical protein
MVIIYMKRFLIFGFIFILKFEILAFLIFFFVAFWVHERCVVMMFDGCTCGRTIIQIFFVLVFIFMIFFYTWSMTKNVKMQIQARRCPTF